MADYIVGQQVPEVVTPPLTRLNIAYMAVAMRDHNMVHLDDDFAGRSGFDSVIAHGTFAVAYMGVLVTRLAGAGSVLRLTTQLRAPMFPGDHLVVAGVVTSVTTGDGKTIVELALEATKPGGVVVASGSAALVTR